VAVETVEVLRARASRRVRVTLAHPPACPLELPGATLVSGEGTNLTFAVRGDINRVVRRLAELDLADVTVEPARLEEVFLDYYDEP
jgi:ABC-2 type transport system ATP-binding protein